MKPLTKLLTSLIILSSCNSYYSDILFKPNPDDYVVVAIDSNYIYLHSCSGDKKLINDGDTSIKVGNYYNLRPKYYSFP